MEGEPIFQEDDVFTWLLSSQEAVPPSQLSPGSAAKAPIAKHDHNASFGSLPLNSERFNWAEDVFLDWPESSNVNPDDNQPFSLTPEVARNSHMIRGDATATPAMRMPPKATNVLNHSQQYQTKTPRQASSFSKKNQSKGNQGGKSRVRAPLSPRSLAQREKNREAVRNCRKRKKEHAQILKERSVLLEEENSRLRLQLQLGSEEMQRLKNDQGEELLREMLQALASTSTDSSHLAQLNQKYMDRLVGHTRDRQAAIQYILSRLNRMLQPARPTKMYLWQMAQDDSFFDEQKGGIWQALCRELELTDVQQSLLKSRRTKVVRLRSDIANAVEKLHSLQHSLQEYYVQRNDGMLFRNLAKVLEPKQLSRYFQLATDPGSILNTPDHQAVFNTAWENMLDFLDKTTRNPETSYQQAASMSKSLQSMTPNSSISASPSLSTGTPGTVNAVPAASPSLRVPTNGMPKHKALQVQRERVLQSLTDLFTLAENSNYVDPRLSDDIVLFDPNNGGQFHGIKKVLTYIRRITLAFSGNSNANDGLVAKLVDCRVDDDKGRASWIMNGTYNGKLRRISNKEKDSPKPEKQANGEVSAKDGEKAPASATNNGGTEQTKNAPQQQTENSAPRVSFKVVVAYKFAHKSDKVIEMVVSWDALSLMRQLRLLPPAPPGGSHRPNAKSRGFMDSKTAGLRKSILSASGAILPPKPLKLNVKRAEELCREMRGVFEADNPEEAAALAARILDPKCCFHDSNMGGKFHGIEGCLQYIERLRGPFPKFRVKTINITPLGSPKEPRMQMGWAVEAVYGGALVTQKKQCEFNGVFFVGFSPVTHTISQVQMSWNATTLMLQLGVIAAAK